MTTGLVSFLKNVTDISAYRTELHEDIELSFERFKVPAQVRPICRDMAQACFDARSSHGEKEASAKATLKKKSKILFDEHVGKELAELGALDARTLDDKPEWFAPPAQAAKTWLLLDYVYAFCFAKDEKVIGVLTKNFPVWMSHQKAEGISLDAALPEALAELRHRGPRAKAAVLAKALGAEYGTIGWARTW